MERRYIAMDSKEKVRILRATTLEHYHNVPSDLDLVTISPEQNAIFQYLAAVKPDDFQYFVADVLVMLKSTGSSTSQVVPAMRNRTFSPRPRMEKGS